VSVPLARSRLVLRVLIAFACGLAVACGSPPSTEGGSPGDVAGEVRTTIERYLQGVESRDTAAIRAAFVDDGRLAWMEGGEVRYRSVDAMLASLEGFPPDAAVHTRLDDLTIVPVGTDGAHAWARFQTTVSGPGGFAFGGALSLVLERTPRGWRIVGGHSS